MNNLNLPFAASQPAADKAESAKEVAPVPDAVMPAIAEGEAAGGKTKKRKADALDADDATSAPPDEVQYCQADKICS